MTTSVVHRLGLSTFGRSAGKGHRPYRKQSAKVGTALQRRFGGEEVEHEVAALETGSHVPDAINMSLETTSDTDLSIAQALANGPVLVGLYKSSCQASKTMFPFLERLHQRHADSPLTVLGVSQDSLNVTRSFARRGGVTFPILIEGDEYPLSKAFDIMSTPTVYLIKADGTIAYETMGFFKDPVNELGNAVAELVGADPSPLYTDQDSDIPAFVPG